MREEHPELLLFDTGDFLPLSGDEAHSEVVLRAYGLTDFDFIALGEQDILPEQSKEFSELLNQLPVGCANLESLDDSVPALPAYKIFEQSGVKIGVTAVISPMNYALGSLGESYQLTDWQTALTETLDEMEAADCEVLILLSHLGIPGEIEAAQTFPRLDLIVGGHSGLLRKQVETGEGVPIVWAGRLGRYVGLVQLSLAAEDRGSVVSFELAPVDSDVTGREAEITALVLTYEEGRYRDWLANDYQSVGEKEWDTNAQCGRCHSDEYYAWQESDHAGAYAALADIGEHINMECLACHTVGFSQAGGFASMEQTPGLTDVGCMTCHDTPAGHPRSTMPKPISAETCTVCHVAGRDDEFDYHADLKLIQH